MTRRSDGRATWGATGILALGTTSTHNVEDESVRSFKGGRVKDRHSLESLSVYEDPPLS